MRFLYCPQCGKPLIEKEIGDEGKIPFCTNCQRPWLDMFSSCIIVLVVNENNEAVLLRQNYISTEYRNLVSGYMKPGETAEETAEREVFEEIGVKLEELNLTGTYWFDLKDMLMIGFIARAKKTEFRLSEEVDGADWIPVEEAIGLVHPKGSVSYALLEIYCEQLKNNNKENSK